MSYDTLYMRDAAERMQRAGWITSFEASKNGLRVIWTAKGIDAAKRLMAIYDELTPRGGHMEPEALSHVIALAMIQVDDTFSP